MKPKEKLPFLQRLYKRFCFAIYEEWAWIYDLTSWCVSFGHWTSWRRLALNYIEGQRVLEIGFGTGALQADLIKLKKQVYGVDLACAMQRITKKRLQKLNLTSYRARSDGRYLPFSGQCMDHLIATFPEEYIIYQDTLNECSRVLKKGGSLIIVGRWITLESIWLKFFFPVFYRKPSEEDQKLIQDRLRQAGLSFEVESKQLGLAKVYAIIAKKL